MPNKEQKDIINLRKFIKESFQAELLNEATYKVYHGTNEKFKDFDFSKTAEGTIWFTDSIDSIKKGEHGGDGNKYILTRNIVLNNPAGWDEYEKYSIGELINMGFDGVVLPDEDKTDYIVFFPESIKK